jgi:hypothetical protein
MAAPVTIFSHWSKLIEGLETSSKDYYASVASAVNEREMTDIKISRVEWSQGGLFSAKRQYLRVQRKELVFDICGAPFGNGFFFSWWLGERPSGLLALVAGIPILGPVALWIHGVLIKPNTFYKLDTASMFQTSVHAAVLEVIDELTAQSGLRALSELERKPINREIFGGR